MRRWLIGLAMGASAWAHAAEPMDTGRGFTELPRQRVELEGCAFELPMRGDFEIRLTKSGTPRLANFNGKLIPGKVHRIGETHIEFKCVATSDLDSLSNHGIERVEGRWVFGDACEGWGDTCAAPVALKGRNWTGLGMAATRSAVPTEERARILMFCLLREPTALCIRTSELQYEVRPKENALPYVLDFVRHIVLVDAPAPTSPQAPASAPGE